MKVKNYFLIFLFIVILNLLGCKINNSPLEVNNKTNIIMNSSFEFNGQPSLNYWNIRDSSEIGFSNDIPIDGSKWSISLQEEWYGPALKTLSYFVPLSLGRHNLKFSVYGKSENIHGSAFLILHKGGESKIIAQNLITDRNWTQYSTIDSQNFSEGDSLFVLIDGGGTELVDGIAYFDLVELELIESD